MSILSLVSRKVVKLQNYRFRRIRVEVQRKYPLLPWKMQLTQLDLSFLRPKYIQMRLILSAQAPLRLSSHRGFTPGSKVALPVVGYGNLTENIEVHLEICDTKSNMTWMIPNWSQMTSNTSLQALLKAPKYKDSLPGSNVAALYLRSGDMQIRRISSSIYKNVTLNIKNHLNNTELET